jgi:uncharacterized protein YkwD
VLKRFIAFGATALLLLPAAASARITTGERTLLAEMNRARVQHGLGRLHVDAHLQRAARAHSHEMLATGVFQHGAFGSRMRQFDVTGRLAGENLAWGTGARGSARGIVAAWLASPEHRANLLRPSFTRVGIGELVGAFQGAGGADVVTADFAG